MTPLHNVPNVVSPNACVNVFLAGAWDVRNDLATLVGGHVMSSLLLCKLRHDCVDSKAQGMS